jgi:thioredoxin 1
LLVLLVQHRPFFMADVTNAHTFTFDDLRDAVQTADGPVIVDFWEPRCSACRATLDTIDDLACRVEGRGVVGTFNVRENPEAVRSLGVETVPTVVVFQDGNVESVLQGAEKIQTFVDRIDEEVFFGQPPSCER